MAGIALLQIAVILGAVIEPMGDTPLSNTKPTSDSGQVVVERVQTVFKRKRALVDVQQTFQLRCRDGKVFQSKSGYVIKLARGASEPVPLGGDDDVIEISDDSVAIKGPIDSEGLIVSVRYNLSIRDGTIVLDQAFASEIKEARAFSEWTEGDVVLSGIGFTPQETRTLANGLDTLAIFSRNLGDGQLHVRLTGLSDGIQRLRSVFTLCASTIILALGIALWIRREVSTRN